MPAWYYVGGNISWDTSAANFTPGSLPSGSPAQGDLITFAINIRNGEGAPTLSGDWTLINNSPTTSNSSTGSGSISQLFVYYCIRGASDPSYAITRGSGTPDLCNYGFHVFRPASGYQFTSASLVTSSAETDGAATSSHTHASVTSDAVDSLIGHYVATGSSSGISFFDAATDPTADSGTISNGPSNIASGTMTDVDVWQRRGNQGTSNLLDGSLHLGVAFKSAAGATGQLSATMTISRRNASVAFVFKQILIPLDAAAGSYSLTGTDATLTVGRKVDADAGSYSLTGTAAALTKGSVLDAAAGSYALTGTDATLTYTPIGGYTLNADAGSYALTGTDAALTKGSVLDAAPGSYSLTGTDVSLLRGAVLDAASGSYSLTGTDAALTRALVLATDAGAYALTGTDATLTYTQVGLQFVGADNGTDTASMPAHQAGDLILVFAFRDGSATLPTVPGDYTTAGTGSSSGNSALIAWKRAASSGETTGTFTNATSVIVAVYRGVRSQGTPVGTPVGTTGTGLTLTWPAIDLLVPGGTSWVYAAGGTRLGDTDLSGNTGELTNRSEANDATDVAGVWDTAGGVSSWDSHDYTSPVGTSGTWRTLAVEIIAAEPGFGFTADVGSYTITGTDATLSTTGSVVPERTRDGDGGSASPSGRRRKTGYRVYKWQLDDRHDLAEVAEEIAEAVEDVPAASAAAFVDANSGILALLGVNVAPVLRAIESAPPAMLDTVAMVEMDRVRAAIEDFLDEEMAVEMLLLS